MSVEVKFAAFEGGQLRILASKGRGCEVVLALPLSRLLVKMVRVPPGNDPMEYSLPILQSLNPFPDEKLTVSCELVRETEKGNVFIAAAFPEGAADDIGEALDTVKLNVVSIDALVLGQLRGIWTALGESSGRRLVLIRSVDCLSLVVLDGDQPSAIRAVTGVGDLRREVMLSLLEAEDFGGARNLEEVIVVEDGEVVAQTFENGILEAFAPVRTLRIGSDAALVGVAERSRDSASLNALPESWREVLEETRFKAKLMKRLVAAVGVWILVMGTLFGVPVVYDLMTGHQKSLSKQHLRQYNAVKEMKAKVDLIRKYSDHARSSLEIMKAISDRVPSGVTLSSLDYKRDEGVRVRGDTDAKDEIYVFKREMDEMTSVDGERIFNDVRLTGPNKSKNGYSFDLDCQYQKSEEE